MNNNGFQTDLAMEVAEIHKQTGQNSTNSYPDGVLFEESGDANIKITRVKITNENGEKIIGKPCGNYITLEIPGLREDNFSMYDESCTAFSKELEKLMKVEKSTTILIVGLGNSNITPDALGPKVISQINVTRHLLHFAKSNNNPELDIACSVCAISPGVLGTTGIETFEIVKGVVDRVNPSLVMVIDSLSSRKAERISTTIQIADTGISPGSGVGNKRMEISSTTLGRPVIAIGVPTVIDAAILASDAIEMVLDDIKNSDQSIRYQINHLDSIDKNHAATVGEAIQNLIKPYYGSLIVTPKEIDDIIKRVSSVIADGINLSLGNQQHS